MMNIPRLETERLILRAFQADDLEAMTEMYLDPDVVRYLTNDGKPKGREFGWRTMTNHLGHWALRGFGMWALEEKGTGNLVGHVGPYYPATWPGHEVGWAIARPSWGKGYAIEAARASINYARDQLNWSHVIHIIAPDNARSIALAERLGSEHEGEWERSGQILHIYGQDLA